jgi:hypothetical protein
LEDFILTLLDYFFDLTSFWKNFVGFLGDFKTPKGHFEISWPLAALASWCWNLCYTIFALRKVSKQSIMGQKKFHIEFSSTTGFTNWNETHLSAKKCVKLQICNCKNSNAYSKVIWPHYVKLFCLRLYNAHCLFWLIYVQFWMNS